VSLSYCDLQTVALKREKNGGGGIPSAIERKRMSEKRICTCRRPIGQRDRMGSRIGRKVGEPGVLTREDESRAEMGTTRPKQKCWGGEESFLETNDEGLLNEREAPSPGKKVGGGGGGRKWEVQKKANVTQEAAGKKGGGKKGHFPTKRRATQSLAPKRPWGQNGTQGRQVITGKVKEIR